MLDIRIAELSATAGPEGDACKIDAIVSECCEIIILKLEEVLTLFNNVVA